VGKETKQQFLLIIVFVIIDLIGNEAKSKKHPSDMATQRFKLRW